MRLHRLAFENGWDMNVGTVTFTTFNTVDPTCAAAASTAYTLTGGTSESGGASPPLLLPYPPSSVLPSLQVQLCTVVSYRRCRASVPKPPVTEMQNSMPSGEKKVSGLPLVHSTI